MIYTGLVLLVFIPVHIWMFKYNYGHGHPMVEVPSVGDRPPRQFTRRDIAEILEPRVEEMFDLVKREIVRAGYEGMLGAGVVITGGTSLLEGMPDAAERGLNLPVRRGAPTGIGGLRDIVSNPMHALAKRPRVRR